MSFLTNSLINWNEEFQNNSEMVLQICRKFEPSDQDEAEDLAQIVWEHAVRKQDMFDGKSKFGTWLYTVAYRVCLNYIRKKSAVKRPDITYESDIEDEEQSLFDEGLLTDTDSPEEIVSMYETIEQLEKGRSRRLNKYGQ